MKKLETRLKVYGQDCEGTMYDTIVDNEEQGKFWLMAHGLSFFDFRDIDFVVYKPTYDDFDKDYQELLTIMEDDRRCFDELSEAQENFMSTYIYFDGSRLNKYYERFNF